MKNLRVAVAFIAGVAAFSPSLVGQTPQKPSPYTGVSQPPPDDTIISDEAAASAKLANGPAASPISAPASNGVVVAAPAMLASSSVPAASPAVAPPPTVAPVKCNPDDYMVGDSCGAEVAPPAKPRVAVDADADIVTSVPAHPGELPEGTVIRVALNQELSTAQSQIGADFTGRVTADVVFSDKVVIPQGSEVVGKIVRVTEGHRFGSPATIRIRPDLVILPDGSRYVLRAQVIDTSTKSRVDSEGTLKPASQLKKNVIEESAGIGAGAVTGAIIGGGPGALVGTLVGAGVMTTHILVQHPASVNVPKDATVTLSLTQPMSITPALQNN